jgi:hypothetical protein
MVLPDVERWAECWLDLQHARTAALAAGVPLHLARVAETAGYVGMSWGRFALGWDAALRAAGDLAEAHLRKVHRLSRETRLALL